MKRLNSLIPMIILGPVLHAQVAPDIEWQKCLGGSNNEAAYSVQQTTDKGYILTGYSDSNDGDVSGNQGADDYWVTKLDENGNLEWQKSLGGNSLEQANSVKQTSDGGYILAGYSYSNNGNVSGNHGADDYWVVKLDASGNLEWQKCYGGSGGDVAWSIAQTSDDGFIIAGHSSSTDGDVAGNHGQWDYWIVKLDAAGVLDWAECYGGSNNDVAYAIEQTENGGYIVAGYSESNDGNVSGNNGARDYWIVKLDEDGNLAWETFLGSSSYDEAHAVEQTTDGGYIVSGFAGANSGDVTGNNGGYDYWMVKLDGSGNSEWKYCYGGSQNDQAFAVDQTSDGGFVTAGQSQSNNGDVSGNNGGYDFWVVKTDASGILEWQKSLGGTSDDYGAYAVQETSAAGFIVSGATLSNDADVSGNHGGSFYGDWWVVKLESNMPTNIEATATDWFSLFPNLVQSELTIQLSYGVSDAAIRVCDLQGRMIPVEVSYDVKSHSDCIVLNTAGLAPGFYTLQITDDASGMSQTQKFVKAR